MFTAVIRPIINYVVLLTIIDAIKYTRQTSLEIILDIKTKTSSGIFSVSLNISVPLSMLNKCTSENLWNQDSNKGISQTVDINVDILAAIVFMISWSH